MSDPVALALIAGCGTVAASIVAGTFAYLKSAQEFKNARVVIQEQVVATQAQTKAIKAIAIASKSDEVHAAVSQLDAFQKETSEARKSASDRLEQIRGGG